MAEQTVIPEPHSGEAAQRTTQYREHTSTGARKPAHLIPPKPDFNSDHVVKFSAAGADILNTTVVDNAGRSVYRFEKTGPRSFRMLNAEGAEFAGVENGLVHYPGSEGVKAHKFILKDSGKTGNTGPVFHHNGQAYEYIQENFYAIIRATPGGDQRVAIVYNFIGEPAVEILPDGLRVPDMLPAVVFATALMESGFIKRNFLARLFAARSK